MSKFTYQSFLESVQDLRKYLAKEPKFSEKGRELDSGGRLEPELANIMISILSEIEKEIPNIKVTITTGNDAFHQRLKAKSKHRIGRAIDFTISPYNASTGEKVRVILDKFSAGNPGFAYLDEYTKPSKYSTGGHFHISYDPKSPEGTHARKIRYEQRPIYFSIPSNFDTKASSDEVIPLDTWAGFLKRLERNQ